MENNAFRISYNWSFDDKNATSMIIMFVIKNIYHTINWSFDRSKISQNQTRFSRYCLSISTTSSTTLNRSNYFAVLNISNWTSEIYSNNILLSYYSESNHFLVVKKKLFWKMINAMSKTEQKNTEFHRMFVPWLIIMNVIFEKRPWNIFFMFKNPQKLFEQLPIHTAWNNVTKNKVQSNIKEYRIYNKLLFLFTTNNVVVTIH